MVQENIEQFWSEDESQQINRLKTIIIDGLQGNVANEEIIQQAKELQIFQQQLLADLDDGFPWIEEKIVSERDALKPLTQALLLLKESEIWANDEFDSRFDALLAAVDTYEVAFDEKERFIESDGGTQSKILNEIPYGEQRDEYAHLAARKKREEDEVIVKDMIAKSPFVPNYIASKIA